MFVKEYGQQNKTILNEMSLRDINKNIKLQLDDKFLYL